MEYLAEIDREGGWAMGEVVLLPRPPAALAYVGVRRARGNRGAARWGLAAKQPFGCQRRLGRGQYVAVTIVVGRIIKTADVLVAR